MHLRTSGAARRAGRGAEPQRAAERHRGRDGEVHSREGVPPGDARHDVVDGRLVLNGGREVRPTSSKHGRYMTTFRKALREPVMAADGTCLNMHEVEAARERWRRKGRS